MPDITIRGIPDLEIGALQRRAARHGRSLEEEARHLLHEAAAEQLLVMELERATTAAEARLRAVHTPAASAPATAEEPGPVERSHPPRRRRVRYEPTPRSR